MNNIQKAIFRLCGASTPNGSTFFSVAIQLIRAHKNPENCARINSAKKFIDDNFPIVRDK